MTPNATQESLSHRAGAGLTRPAIPETREAAQAVLPWFAQRAIDTYRAFARAKQDWQRAKGELDIVQSVARGDFEQDPSHAVGSGGPWRVV